jgi:hypothetical protein
MKKKKLGDYSVEEYRNQFLCKLMCFKLYRSIRISAIEQIFSLISMKALKRTRKITNQAP